MRRIVILACWLLGVSLAGAAVPPSARMPLPTEPEPILAPAPALRDPSDRLTWFARLDEALAEAAMEYRSVILLVTTRGCPHCHRLKNSTLQDESIQRLLRHFSRVEIDAGLRPDVANQYGVRGVPALLFLTSDGRERGRIEGFIARDQLESLLRSLLDERAVQTTSREEEDWLAVLREETITAEQWGDLLAVSGSPRIRSAARERLLKMDPFPREMLVGFLSDARLAVRLASLEWLEEAAGDDFGFDPWRPPAQDDAVPHEPLQRWLAWAGADPSGEAVFYAALTEEQIRAYLRDLVSGQRQRSLRAMRMLTQSGPGTLPIVQAFETEHPDAPEGMRNLIREVRYALQLPAGERVDRSAIAHRLVFGHQDVRLKALRDLGPHALAVLPILEEHLLSDEALVREAAVEAILGGAGRRALHVLSDHAERERNLDVLITLVRGLGRLQTRSAVQVLVKFLDHEHEDVVIAALQSIQRSQDRAHPREVLEALGDERWRVRVAALDAVGALRLLEASDTVEQLLHDEDAFVRYKAVQTIALVQKKRAVDGLIDLFLKEDSLKGPIIETLCSLEARLPDSFGPVLDQAELPVLLSVVEALQKCGTRGLALAARLAAHPNNDVACGALRTIGKDGLQHPRYRGILQQALESDDRARVLAALESMNHQNDFWGPSYAPSFLPFDNTWGGGVGGSAAIEDDLPLDGALADLMDAFLGAPAVEQPPPPAPDTTVDDLLAFFVEAAASIPDSEDTAEEQSAASAGRQSLLAAIRTHYQGGDEDIRFEAAMLLARAREDHVLPYLRESMDRRTVRQRADLANVLSYWPHEEVLATLKPLLADGSAQVRKAAAESLLFGASRAEWADALFEELRRADTRLTITDMLGWRFRSALRESSSARHFRNHALRLLDDEQANPLRVLGLVLLDGTWRRGDETKVEPFLSDEDPYMRRAAARALARNHPRSFIQQIDRIRQDVSEHVRFVLPVAYAQEAPWTHLFDDEQRTRESFETRSDIWRSLTADMRQQLLAAVRDLAHDGSPRVRVEAFFALLSRNQEIDVDAFVRTVQSFSDPSELGRRIGDFLRQNYRRLNDSYAPLVAYLDHSGLNASQRESIIRHFEGAPAAEAVEERIVATRQATTAILPSGEIVVASDVEEEPEFVPGSFRLVFFEEPGCAECEQAKEYLAMLQSMFPEMQVERHVIFHVRGRELIQRYADFFDVPSAWRMVTPTLFAAGGYLVRDDVTFDAVSDLVVRSLGVPDDEWYISLEESDDLGAETLAEIEAEAEPTGPSFPIGAVFLITGVLLFVALMRAVRFRKNDN